MCDCEELVELISVMDDGIMNAYFTYLLIKPDCQQNALVKNFLRVELHYKEYLAIAVVTKIN